MIIDENGKPKMNMDGRWEYELRGISYMNDLLYNYGYDV